MSDTRRDQVWVLLSLCLLVPDEMMWLRFQSAIYKGDYTATHPTVRMFWETFHAFPLEKKKKFLCKYLVVLQSLPKVKT